VERIRISTVLVAFVALLATGCATVPADEGWTPVAWRMTGASPFLLETTEQPVAVDEVPEAVRAAAARLVPAGAEVAYEAERRGDAVFYEAEWDTPTGEREVTLSEAGVLIESEEEIAAGQAPPGVRAVVPADAEAADVSYSRRNVVLYEIEYVLNGEEYEVLVNPLGEVIGTEASPAPAVAEE